MFTGIIEALGKVVKIGSNGSNNFFWIQSNISNELKIDQSVAHNGVCLTVEAKENDSHKVTAIAETLNKTNLGILNVGDTINLERCLQMNGRIDGHIVQGHVDGTAKCIDILPKNGSSELQFEIDEIFSNLIIEKGSICLNGISLTIFNVQKTTFWVAIIPYTWEHTNISNIEIGNLVNVEFDLLGKYIQRNISLNLIKH